MKSVTTSKFRKAFNKLPVAVQQKARNAYKRWCDDPQHPSLRFKKIHTTEPIYSVRIDLNYRAIGILAEDNTIIWFWIGSHEAYNELISSL